MKQFILMILLVLPGFTLYSHERICYGHDSYRDREKDYYVISAEKYCVNEASPILDTISKTKLDLIGINNKKLAKRYGSEFTDQYKNYLLVPYVDLKNLHMTPEVFMSNYRTIGDTIMTFIKKDPTVLNLRLGKNFKYDLCIYDDDFDIYYVLHGYFISPPLQKNQMLLKFYLSLNANLLFHFWGLNDFFVLIGNQIYMLEYNNETQSCELIRF